MGLSGISCLASVVWSSGHDDDCCPALWLASSSFIESPVVSLLQALKKLCRRLPKPEPERREVDVVACHAFLTSGLSAVAATIMVDTENSLALFEILFLSFLPTE
ncbi:hypothetical protein PG987_006124 [Apiospora arundinis]